jgi:cell wall assembly regulator SMI1
MRTQRAASITWENCKEPATDESIEEVEQAFGVKFPDDFWAVMQVCHGGIPVERSDFYFWYPGLGRRGSGIGVLLNFVPDDDYSILKTTKRLLRNDRIPERVILFAEDGGGDAMCLDYREGDSNPKIVYWSHEEEKEQSIIPLADSFSEFLDQLIPPEYPPET